MYDYSMGANNNVFSNIDPKPHSSLSELCRKARLFIV